MNYLMFTKTPSSFFRVTTSFLCNAVCVFVVFATLNGCDDDDEATGTRIKLRNDATLGMILTDRAGRTLYYFANDATTANTCTGTCEAFWPPYTLDNFTEADMPEGLSFGDFSTIATASGKTQVVFKGRPLYYYAPLSGTKNTLEAVGLTSGENVDNVWFVAKPDYTIMLTNAQLVGADGQNYLSNGTVGNGSTLYFTDSKGMTLYTWKFDEPDKNNFTASDFSNNSAWPIYETDQVVVPSSLDKNLFGSIDVYGKKQLTYNGWPLYYFGGDANTMGSTKGASNTNWPVAVKDLAGPGPKEIKVATHATLGKILTDKTGRTLYWFAADATTTNNCSGGCAAIWPVFNVDNLAATQVGSGLSFSDFSSITLASGAKQTTYKGRPLYYYAPSVGGVNTPEAAGETKGEAVGGVWFVAKPDYSIMLTRAQLIGLDGNKYTSTYTVGTGLTVYFTDMKGLTLYTFSSDKNGLNTFTNATFSNNASWPIYETDKIVVPSTLDKTLFTVITVHGKNQLAYKGWPLYYYGGDASTMGSNKGVSVPTPGKWPVGVKDMAVAPN